MPKKVLITNNPYKNTIGVTIDGKPTSIYSEIRKFDGEPFRYWFDKILPLIFNECNHSDFELVYCSTAEECRVMKKIATDYEHCIDYIGRKPYRDDSVVERLKSLADNLYEEEIVHREKLVRKILFVVQDSFETIEEELEKLDVENCFCKFESSVIRYNDYTGQGSYDLIFFLINRTDEISTYPMLRGRRVFLLVAGKNSEFVGANDCAFIYSVNLMNPFETIFECLKLFPLCEILGKAVARVNDYEVRRKIVEIEPVPVLCDEKNIVEVGAEVTLSFVDMDSKLAIPISSLNVDIKPSGYVDYTNGLLRGLKEGNIQVEISRKGEYTPCCNFAYRVIKRNRVRELESDRAVYILGVGDKCKVDFRYLPDDADNVDKIRWSSSDESVVRVNINGELSACAVGSCKLRCEVEAVSLTIGCQVKPYLREVRVKQENVSLMIGQECELQVEALPCDSVDAELEIASTDLMVANVCGHKIKAIGIGNTTIVICNKKHTIRREVQVTVVEEQPKKRSFFSSFFRAFER